MSDQDKDAEIQPERENEFQREASWLAASEKDTTLECPEDFAAAGEIMREVKASIARVVEFFRPLKETAWNAHKQIVAKEKAIIEPREAVARAISAKMVAYKDAERKRLEAERKEAEARARAAEEERRLAQAVELEAVGMAKEADQVLSAPVQVAVPVQAEIKAAGVSFREIWRFRIENLSIVPREYLMLDEKKVGAIVKAMKAQTAIPGIQAYSETTTATTTR